MRSKSTVSGFTLIELIVVVSIIAVLSVVGLLSFTQASISGRNSKRKADLQQLSTALVLYKGDNNVYPPTYPSGYTNNTQEYPPMTTLLPYLNSVSNTVVDPKNAAPYLYYYQTDTKTFTLCANLEPQATSYCVQNP